MKQPPKPPKPPKALKPASSTAYPEIARRPKQYMGARRVDATSQSRALGDGWTCKTANKHNAGKTVGYERRTWVSPTGKTFHSLADAKKAAHS